MRFLYTFIFLSFANILLCQSYYYNTEHFGLRSTLLGGSVIAGNEDLSMVYYNPAALIYGEDKALDVSLIIPSLDFYNYGAYFDSGTNTSNLDFSLEPSIFTYKTGIGSNLDVVITLLQKDFWDRDITYKQITNIGDMQLDKSFKYKYSGSERLYGFGGSYRLNQNISLGLSQFWRDFGTKYRTLISSKVVDQEGLANDEVFSESINIEYDHNFSMITKCAIAGAYDAHKFGIVLTTPDYLPISKGASYEKLISIKSASFTSIENIIDDQLEPNLREAWELNLGYGYTFGDSSKVYLSTSLYTGFQDRDLLQFTDDSDDVLALRVDQKSIVNVSIGYHRQLTAKTKLLCSYRTNKSSYRNKPTTATTQRIYVLNADKHHFALGLNRQGEKSSFIIGVDYGFGMGNTDELLLNFPNLEIFDQHQAAYTNRELTLLVTYEFFLDSFKKNINKMMKTR